MQGIVCVCVAWLNSYVWDMTHSYVGHDSFIQEVEELLCRALSSDPTYGPALMALVRYSSLQHIGTHRDTL